MKDFEASAEPLQDWLTETRKMVQESGNRLHDLPAKKREQQKLQVIIIDMHVHTSEASVLSDLWVIISFSCPGYSDDQFKA